MPLANGNTSLDATNKKISFWADAKTFAIILQKKAGVNFPMKRFRYNKYDKAIRRSTLEENSDFLRSSLLQEQTNKGQIL